MLGDTEPLTFLHAWLDWDDPKGVKPHNLCDPPKDRVRAMAAAHGDEIKRIMNSFDLRQ